MQRHGVPGCVVDGEADEEEYGGVNEEVETRGDYCCPADGAGWGDGGLGREGWMFGIGACVGRRGRAIYMTSLSSILRWQRTLEIYFI